MWLINLILNDKPDDNVLEKMWNCDNSVTNFFANFVITFNPKLSVIFAFSLKLKNKWKPHTDHTYWHHSVIKTTITQPVSCNNTEQTSNNILLYHAFCCFSPAGVNSDEVLASTEEGGGVREVNYIYALPCPTGPR